MTLLAQRISKVQIMNDNYNSVEKSAELASKKYGGYDKIPANVKSFLYFEAMRTGEDFDNPYYETQEAIHAEIELANKK